jgi:hypothetical protein
LIPPPGTCAIGDDRRPWHAEVLTCCFFGVGEGTRTPGPQDHNLVL